MTSLLLYNSQYQKALDTLETIKTIAYNSIIFPFCSFTFIIFAKHNYKTETSVMNVSNKNIFSYNVNKLPPI